MSVLVRVAAGERLLPDVTGAVAGENILEGFAIRRPAQARKTGWHLKDMQRRATLSRDDSNFKRRHWGAFFEAIGNEIAIRRYAGIAAARRCGKLRGSATLYWQPENFIYRLHVSAIDQPLSIWRTLRFGSSIGELDHIGAVGVRAHEVRLASVVRVEEEIPVAAGGVTPIIPHLGKNCSTLASIHIDGYQIAVFTADQQLVP